MECLESGSSRNAEPETASAHTRLSAARRFVASFFGWCERWNQRRFGCAIAAPIPAIIHGFSGLNFDQTSSIGALTGVTIGPTGTGLSGMAVHLINQGTVEFANPIRTLVCLLLVSSMARQ